MKNFRILYLIALTHLILFTASGQDNRIQKLKNKNLTYYWVGKFCPTFPNTYLRYGFKMKCIECIQTMAISRNNKRTVRKINKVFGKGWFDENRLKL